MAEDFFPLHYFLACTFFNPPFGLIPKASYELKTSPTPKEVESKTRPITYWFVNEHTYDLIVVLRVD